MAEATGIGSHSGTDEPAFAEALRVVVGELGPDERGVPYLPEVPGRGAHAMVTGRATAIWAELGADLQPAGWRLTGGGGGIDQRRARSLLAQDLDRLEEQAQGYAGRLKVQVGGPWTLAATVERPRGDRVLADHGARRDLAEALAEGVRGHVADVRRRVPEARLIVQVDEPALPAVLAARVPTASGWGKHRAVDRPEASAALEGVLRAIEESGAEPWVHCCDGDVPADLLVGAGARGLLVDLGVLAPTAYDALAQLVEDGGTVGLGVVPTTGDVPAGGAAAERVLRFAEMLGLDPEEVTDRWVVTPACGLAGRSPAEALTSLRACRQAASDLP